MKTYIVGDIHGCVNTLYKLLNLIHFVDGEDRLFCTGDLIDRGNFSTDVLQLFQGEFLYKSVRGNHDDKFLRWFKGNNVTLSEKDGNYGSHLQLQNSPYKDFYINILESLPLVLHPTKDTTVVHAGFYPWQNHLEFEEIFDKKKRTCMYIRHLNYNSKLKPINQILNSGSNGKNEVFDESLPMWYDLYKEQEYGGTVFFGHQPMKEPLIVEGKTRIIGLDTGACFGNKLTCYCLETDQFYSVNTLKDDLDERSIREL
jgi:hypothetical protein